MRTEIVSITPQKAGQMLGGKNRPVRNTTVDRYASDMKNGNWKLTHQGIAIDTDGYVIDGQHRLLAIIKANVAVSLMVTYGIEREKFDVFDSGSNRTASDTLSLDGMKPRLAKCLTSSIPFCINYEKYGSVFRSLAGRQGNSTILIREYVENNPNIIKSAEYAQTMPYRDSVLRQSIVCFLHYQISKKYDNAEEFLNKLLIGDNISQDSVIFAMRKQLIATRMKTFITPETVLIKRIIYAYNYYNKDAKNSDWRQTLGRVNNDTVVEIR